MTICKKKIIIVLLILVIIFSYLCFFFRKNKERFISINGINSFDKYMYINLERRKDRKRQIEEALGNLTSEQRDAIQLVYFFEMRQQEAADSLGLSLAALESLLRRARKKLHTVLNKNYEELY